MSEQAVELTCDDRPIWDAWLAMFHLPTIAAADRLGIFKALAEEPMQVHEISERFRLTNRGIEALLGVLVALGLVAKLAERFHITPVARIFLVPGSPYYWGPMVQLLARTAMSSELLLNALSSEKSLAAAKRDLFRELKGRRLDEYIAAMHCHSFPAARALANLVDFGSDRLVLDVGGGSGGLSIAIAQSYPKVCCKVLDLPAVCNIADRYVNEFGIKDRVKTLGLDMFRSKWPRSADAIILSNVLHDWGNLRRMTLLRKAFDSLRTGGRVIIHEILMNNDKTGPSAAACFSMNLLFTHSGRQFSLREVENMMTHAGFREFSTIPTFGYYSVVIGQK